MSFQALWKFNPSGCWSVIPRNPSPSEYTYRAVEGRMAFLEWAYEDASVRVRDGADSYLIEDGKIVAQTIHYTVEQQ
jgi:hypothetical protein